MNAQLSQVLFFARAAVRGMLASLSTSVVAVVTIGVSLVLVGAFLLLVTNMEQMLDEFGDALHVTAFLEEGLDEERQHQLAALAGETPGVESVRLVSKLEALERFRSGVGRGAALLEGLSENPLPASIEISLAPDHRSAGGLSRVADAIENAITVEFNHLADATASAIQDSGVSSVALLGTRYTMEQAFYRDRLVGHGLDVRVPDEPGRTTVHDIIFGELVRGKIRQESKAAYLAVIAELIAQGAEGVIAGCTEIELLVQPSDVNVPYFPTTAIHAMAAVDAALA